MDHDLMHARTALGEGYTLVLCRGDERCDSRSRGIAPLLALLDSGKSYAGFSAADRAVGKAAACLYCLLGVQAVYAPLVSQGAVEVLRRHGIGLHYDRCVRYILNRRQDGLCPMEQATLEAQDPQQALEAIRCALKRL